MPRRLRRKFAGVKALLPAVRLARTATTETPTAPLRNVQQKRGGRKLTVRAADKVPGNR